MNYRKIEMSEDVAKLILRLTVGGLVLLHGIFKITSPMAIGYISGLFEGVGLPAYLAHTVYIGEVIAPILLIVGYRTRIASALVVLTLSVVILLVHTDYLFTLNKTGGSAVEVQLFYLFGALAIFGLGAGKYSLDKWSNRSKEVNSKNEAR